MIRRGIRTSRADDQIDVGVLKFSGPNQPPYPEVQKAAMPASYLQSSKVPRSGRHYVIIGYPYTKNRFSIRQNAVVASAFAYRSDSISEEEYASHGLDPETHIILPFDKKSGFDSKGKKVNIPKPTGMSGGPIAVLYSDEVDDFRAFPVVAVGIEYRSKSSIVVATDVGFVIEAIANAD